MINFIGHWEMKLDGKDIEHGTWTQLHKWGPQVPLDLLPALTSLLPHPFHSQPSLSCDAGEGGSLKVYRKCTL